MTARVGIARSLSGAELSLQHYGVDPKEACFTEIGDTTCAAAMLVARKYVCSDSGRIVGRVVKFTVAAPAARNRCWGSPKRPTDLYAYAVVPPPNGHHR